MADPEPITVLIADDHGVVREGLHALLEREGIHVVGEAATGREAVTLADQWRPDVVLLDIRMPDGDGLRALADIKARHPETSVIMLTVYDNPGYLARAVAYGAAGYLLKGIEPERIPHIVRAAARGEHLLDRDLLRTILAQATVEIAEGGTEEPAIEPLSEREREVLCLIAEGLSNEAIAEALYISLATVKTHVRHILQKLGVSDRTQAAVWAVRHGVAPRN